jgi:UDP-N-acetylglucosamine--N-acetylmuramyl-(pentapeptide) pyrophosphoryl-undecaprenol N-acetylglucosamine transferase
VTGTPLRESIVAIDRSPVARAAARAAMVPPIDDGRSVVVVMTGSLGSTTVNRAVIDLARRWSNRRDRTIVHVAGRRDVEFVRAHAPAVDGLDYRILEFGDMVQLWALCDVAVCRAGASTVAELATLQIPSVLVPLPHAPGDHQMKNALVVVEAGGARLVLDAECTGAKLDEVLETVMTSDTLASMGRAAGTLGRGDAAGASPQSELQSRAHLRFSHPFEGLGLDGPIVSAAENDTPLWSSQRFHSTLTGPARSQSSQNTAQTAQARNRYSNFPDDASR